MWVVAERLMSAARVCASEQGQWTGGVVSSLSGGEKATLHHSASVQVARVKASVVGLA